MTPSLARFRAVILSVLTGLLLLPSAVACTDGGSSPPAASPTPPTSGQTPEEVRARSIQAAREAARELVGLRFAIDGAGGYTQCTDDGEYILFDITVRLRQTPATVAAPRTPAITAALARRGWERDPTRGNSGTTGTSTVLLRGGSVLRVEEYAEDPSLILLELTSDCFDAGDRNSTYVERGSQRLPLT